MVRPELLNHARDRSVSANAISQQLSGSIFTPKRIEGTECHGRRAALNGDSYVLSNLDSGHQMHQSSHFDHPGAAHGTTKFSAPIV
jgi:hypothetical protein